MEEILEKQGTEAERLSREIEREAGAFPAAWIWRRKHESADGV